MQLFFNRPLSFEGVFKGMKLMNPRMGVYQAHTLEKKLNI